MERLAELAQIGWKIRNEHFSPEIVFSYPNKTTAVSVTGAKCQLACAHCGGHYLKHMKTLNEVANMETQPASLLVSGGCTTDGKVPIAEYLQALTALKQDRKYNLHVGLVDECDIPSLVPIADKVSFDFVGADETIQNVLGLSRTVEDYIHCYGKLRRYLPVVPHICIGLDGGRIVGEYRAIRELKKLGASAITFIIFTPTRGTKLAACQPPRLEEVLEVLVAARLVFPDIPLTLGCMRPGGDYRRELDVLAVAVGMNGIVNPAEEAVSRAGENGLAIQRREECCVL